MWRIIFFLSIIISIFDFSYVKAIVNPDTHYNGHGYKIFNNGMTWEQAKSYCENQGGHLVTITSSQEQAIVETLLRTMGNKNSYWVGGCKSGGVWRWITGETFSYSRWATWQPDGDGDALMIYRQNNPVVPNATPLGSWNDIRFDGTCKGEPFFGANNFGFICEWDTIGNHNTVTIADGWYRIQPMHDLSRSVDAAGGNNNIHMWDNLDVPQQKFYLQNRGNGYFSLQTAQDNKFFVTADGRGNGANLYIAYWNNSDSQLFRLIEAGNNSYHIFSKVGVNLNFDCAGGGRSNGNNVQLWTTEDSAWHKWKFTKVNVNSKANFQMESYNLSCHADHQLKFTGRLWNANNNSEITGIHVYIGGGAGAGGQFIGEFSANKPNHSFDHIIDVPKSRNGNQLIVIYAVNGVESKELDRRYISLSQTYTPSGDLQSLISSFTNPPRQKWDNRESNRLGKTCFGFANYIFRELHGVIAASSIDWSNAYILENLGAGVSCRYSGSVNENTLHTIFQQCTPGDFIQSTRNDGTGQHSMIFVSYDANARKVRIFDANFTTDHDNLIQDRNPTVHQFFTRFQKMSVYTK